MYFANVLYSSISYNIIIQLPYMESYSLFIGIKVALIVLIDSDYLLNKQIFI